MRMHRSLRRIALCVTWRTRDGAWRAATCRQACRADASHTSCLTERHARHAWRLQRRATQPNAPAEPRLQAPPVPRLPLRRSGFRPRCQTSRRYRRSHPAHPAPVALAAARRATAPAVETRCSTPLASSTARLRLRRPFSARRWARRRRRCRWTYSTRSRAPPSPRRQTCLTCRRPCLRRRCTIRTASQAQRERLGRSTP